MDNEIKPLIIALTKLVAELSIETASLMESDVANLQRQYVGGQRDKARRIRETGQQVLALCERVLGGES
jgi:hypothetical protein